MPGNKKKFTQAAKKAAARVKGKGNDLTPLGKKLPGFPAHAGDKASNRMAKDASNLVAAGEIASMSPATIMRILYDQTGTSVSPAFGLARALVAKLMLALPNAASSSDSTTSWSPVGALMYLIWALFDSCRRAGVFQNAAMVNAFPPFPAEGFIPVAWAQYLSYLKPYRGPLISAQYTDSNYSALPTAPTNNCVGVNGNGFAAGNGDFSPHPFASGVGLENSLSLGTGTTWASLFTYGAYLSTVWASGLSCVRFDAVPDFAPDASAYVNLMSTITGVKGLTCFTSKFDPEIGSLFYPANVYIASSMGYIKPMPIQPGNHTYYFWWIETFQLCAYVPGANLKKTLKTHMWNQADFATKSSKFKRVRVRGKKPGKKTQPIRFLIGNSALVDSAFFQSMIGMVAGLYGVTLDANKLGVLAFVAMSAFIAKVLPLCYDTLQTNAVPTATYDPRYKNVELPIALVGVLNTLGPVASAGRMIYPTLFSTTTGFDLRGGWLRFSTVGNLNNVESLWNLIYGGTNALTNVVAGPYTFSAANFATTTNYGATPVAATDAILMAYAAAFGATAAPGGATLNLIKPDNHNPIGKANMLIFHERVSSQSANVTTIMAGLTTVTQILKAIGSFHHMAGDELGVAVTCPLIYATDQTGVVTTLNSSGAPFRASMVSGNMTGYLASYVLETMTAEVGEAIAQCLALNRRKTVEIGGVTIDVSQNGDFFGAIVDGIIGPIFGDSAVDVIKSSPIGKIAKGFANSAFNPLGILDEIGVTDGIVSSFGLDNPDLAKLLPMAMAAVAL